MGADIWSAAKLTNPRAGVTVDALTDSDGNRANTIIEKQEMLRSESVHQNEHEPSIKHFSNRTCTPIGY